MKRISLNLVLFVLISFSISASAQTTVASTTGYQVSLNVFPVSIVPAVHNNCEWGYNYQVKMHYNIALNGTNAPASMYTLQGTVTCGNTTSFFDLPNNGGTGNVNSANAWSSTSDCNSANVNNKNCKTVNIQIEGPGISNRIVSMPTANMVLGIKLLSFSATLEHNKVKLAWATASEENNDYFTIEKSLDGTNWQEVVRVKGAGNSGSELNYQAYDVSLLQGTSMYRLKQTDFDGKTSYSNTRSVNHSSSKTVSLFPIPNTGNTINISGVKNYSNYDFTLLSVAGTPIFKTTLKSSSISLPELKAGVYLINLTDRVAGTTENIRYVKM